jgi:hypothetical protein
MYFDKFLAFVKDFNKFMSTLEDKNHTFYHTGSNQLKSLEELNGKLNSNASQRLNDGFTSFREFKLKDPNAMIKIIVLRAVEEVYSNISDSSNFENSLFDYLKPGIPDFKPSDIFTGMIKCQGLLKK